MGQYQTAKREHKKKGGKKYLTKLWLNISKFDEIYKLTDLKSSTNPRQDKHKANPTTIYHRQIAETNAKGKELQSRQKGEKKTICIERKECLTSLWKAWGPGVSRERPACL